MPYMVMQNKQFDENLRMNRAKDVFIVDALDTKIFSVRGSKGDASYTVDLDKGTCTCPDYVYRCAPSRKLMQARSRMSPKGSHDAGGCRLMQTAVSVAIFDKVHRLELEGMSHVIADENGVEFHLPVQISVCISYEELRKIVDRMEGRP